MLSGPNLWHIFDGRLPGGLEDERLGKKVKQRLLRRSEFRHDVGRSTMIVCAPSFHLKVLKRMASSFSRLAGRVNGDLIEVGLCESPARSWGTVPLHGLWSKTSISSKSTCRPNKKSA